MIDLKQIDLVALIERDTHLKKAAGTNGGEWAGPCPVCGGEDRFRVWPTPTDNGNPSFWCRSCNISGDAITYLMKVRGQTFKGAVESLHVNRDNYTLPKRRSAPRPALNIGDVDMNRPCFEPAWQLAADNFITRCFNRLQDEPSGQPGRDYLASRCMTLPMAVVYELGYNDHAHEEIWGSAKVWLPRGIIIPWRVDGQYWNVRVRRMNEDMQPGQQKYISATGNANALLGADDLRPGRPAILCEGEFNRHWLDWIARQQRINVAVVATGSRTGARVLRWVTRLALSSKVLLCLDGDEASKKDIDWWCQALGSIAQPAAVGGDADINDQVLAGVDVGGWLRSAVAA